jgi:hypothetical protein
LIHLLANTAAEVDRMQIRSFLKKVESRAILRDLFRSILWMAALISAGFLLYAGVDRLFSLSFKIRFVITLSLSLAAFVALAIDLTRKNRKRGLMWAAAEVEQRAGTLNNQLVTIAECETNERKLPAYLRKRIEDDLARRLNSITAAQVISFKPERAISVLLFLALASYSLALFFLPQALRDGFRRLVLLDDSESSIVHSATVNESAPPDDYIKELRLALTPPTYTRRSPTFQIGDGNIVALAGTRVDVHITSHKELSKALLSVSGATAAAMSKEGEHSYQASFVVDEDSNYKISLIAHGGENRKWEEIYSIRAVKDNAPEVHITSPASDLIFESENRPASVSIAVTAKDDYEVASMKLKYIHATGEGDAAKFQSGEIAINRLPEDAEGQSRGTARLDLAALGLTASSSLVFHAEVVDRNNVTGPGIGHSENIIVQVRGPEQLKISLDDLRPDDALKYLTSQRMILIKTEKLHRLRGKIAAEEFLARSQQIATEQKRFKESFNQFAEIETSGEQPETNAAQHTTDNPAQPETEEQAKLKSGDVPDIPTGGTESLREMLVAIRAMWKAEGALGAAETARAIEYENEALAHLKAAQSSLRYSPRIIAKPRSVDLKRRYLGELDHIRSRIERVPRKQESAFDHQLRGALALVYDAARSLAHTEREQASANAKIEQARQNVERASDDLLSIKGELASSLLEPASKLRLLGRMLEAFESRDEEKAFGLIVQVASEMSAFLGREERSRAASSHNNLSPAASAKAAAYFKLLANP